MRGTVPLVVGSGRCGSCGRHLAFDATRCGGCGAAAVVEAVDDGAATTVASGGDAGGLRRWKVPAVIVASVVLLPAVSSLVSAGGRSSAATTTSSSSSSAVTAAPVSSTTTVTAPGATIPTATTRPEYREEKLDVSAAVLPAVTLYALTTEWDVLRIDVNAGRYSARHIDATPSDVPAERVQLVARNGGVVVGDPSSRGGEIRFVGDGPGGANSPLAPVTLSARWLPAADPNQVWLVDSTDSETNDRMYAWRVDVHTGATDGRVAMHAATPIGDDGHGSPVVLAAGGAYRVTGDGRLARVAPGLSLVAFNGSTVVEMPCDDSGACRLDVIDVATGHRRTVGPAPEDLKWAALFGELPRGALSTDGRRLALACYTTCWTGMSNLQVVDLTTGAVTAVGPLRHDDSAEQLKWSPDGSWLFWADTVAGTIEAWRSGTMQPVSLRIEHVATFTVAG